MHLSAPQSFSVGRLWYNHRGTEDLTATVSVRTIWEECCIYLEVILNINGGSRRNWRLQWDMNASHVCSLLEQSSLDLLPGVLAALVCVHAKQDAQATRQAAGFLLQQVGLRLSFETLNTFRCTHSYSHRHVSIMIHYPQTAPRSNTAQGKVLITVLLSIHFLWLRAYNLAAEQKQRQTGISRPTCFPQ